MLPKSDVDLYAGIRRDARSGLSHRALRRNDGVGYLTVKQGLESAWAGSVQGAGAGVGPVGPERPGSRRPGRVTRRAAATTGSNGKKKALMLHEAPLTAVNATGRTMPASLGIPAEQAVQAVHTAAGLAGPVL
ncbi:hypothetical protein P3T37_005637 [Kitasatospora sp. MAA4]|uniref:hypothetical protein n=1 Tax=Kitasatospora sp. MAA4 TaxID=3035093 RepID=UPI00247585B4|nr:hypothetical protein [Kitasatospora sp. MAA4]MDH6136218.1 hypothetical protein [Kitasatospora sp. MAA4]